MNNTDKVIVKSAVGGRICIYMPQNNFRREWTRKGAKIPIEKNTLKEIYYDVGVENLFRTGILFIDDLEFKKEIGLEPEDATVPTNVIELTDALLTRYVTVMPAAELRTALKKLSKIQRREVVDYAIVNNEQLTMDKIKVFTELTGVDLQVAIKNKRAEMEEIKLPKED